MLQIKIALGEGGQNPIIRDVLQALNFMQIGKCGHSHASDNRRAQRNQIFRFIDTAPLKCFFPQACGSRGF